MSLSQFRQEIDSIDRQLLPLFIQRMALSAQIADYKKEQGLPIYVPQRETEILDRIAFQAGSEMADYAKELYAVIFQLSKEYQEKRLDTATTCEVTE